MTLSNSYKLINYILVFFVLGASFFSGNTANATTYYVATNGNNSNPGTNSQPFQTINEGVQALSAGDTLFVKSGTYAESIRSTQVSIPNGTSWNNPITVAANPGDTVTIKPLANNAFFWILDGQSKYLIIKGFIVDGANTALHGFKFEGGTKYVRVRDSEVKNTKHSGILVTNGNSTSSNRINTHHEFINLKVHHNGSSNGDHGFYIETSHNLVASSAFYNNRGNGGKFFHGNLSGAANNNIARNNRFYNNSVAGLWSCGLLLSSGNGNQAYNNVAYGNFAGFCIQARVSNARLYNNITYNNDIYGIYVGNIGNGTTGGSRVENNTAYQNGTYGIFVGDGATTSTVKNNIAWSNSNNLRLTNATSSNNSTSNPVFVNAASKNFHLQASSPAIDKGTSISGLSTGHDGNPRPTGAQFDIGAYEFQGSSSTGGGGSTSGGGSTGGGGSTSGGGSTGGGGSTSGGGSTTTTTSFPPSIASPALGSTLTTSSVTFSGAHTSQDLEHLLRVGTTFGGSNLYNQKLGTGHSATVSGLPTTGTIYVGFWTRNSDGWFVNQTTFTMNVGGSSTTTTTSGSTTSSSSTNTTTSGSTTTTSSFPPPIASPALGSTLTTSSVTFSGAHTNQDLEHLLRVGTTSGGSNLYNKGLGTGHSASVSGLPTTGTIYVGFWTRNNNGWFVNQTTFTMNVGGSSSTGSSGSTSGGDSTGSGTTVTTSSFPPPIFSPTVGSTLRTSSVTFSGAHTSQDLEHLLRVGTTPGGSNLYNQKLGAGHSATVSGLPTSGKIYVGFWTRNGHGWFVNHTTFTMNR